MCLLSFPRSAATRHFIYVHGRSTRQRHNVQTKTGDVNAPQIQINMPQTHQQTMPISECMCMHFARKRL